MDRVLIERLPEYDTARVTFAEKPDRAVIEMLKAAGFYLWNGRWSGRLEKLPSAVADLEGKGAS